jgi:hypothetical protein
VARDLFKCACACACAVLVGVLGTAGAALVSGCGRRPAETVPGGAGGAPPARDEVVEVCASKRMPAVLAEQGSKLGPSCAKAPDAVVVQLFEAGAHLGVERGTAGIRRKGLAAAMKQFKVADDIAAKISARADGEVKKAEDDAAAEEPKAVARIAADPCLVSSVALAIVQEGARCGASALDTEEYRAEFARAYGGICEHTLTAAQCAQQADSEYASLPRE